MPRMTAWVHFLALGPARPIREAEIVGPIVCWAPLSGSARMGARWSGECHKRKFHQIAKLVIRNSTDNENIQ